MTAAAWTMLAITWTIVAGITLRLFLLVLRTPVRPDGDDER